MKSQPLTEIIARLTSPHARHSLLLSSPNPLLFFFADHPLPFLLSFGPHMMAVVLVDDHSSPKDRVDTAQCSLIVTACHSTLLLVHTKRMETVLVLLFAQGRESQA